MSLKKNILFIMATVLCLTACKTMPTISSQASPQEPGNANRSDTGPTAQNVPPQNHTSETAQNSEPAIQTNAPGAASVNITSDEQIQQLEQQLDDRFTDFDRLLLRERDFLVKEQNQQGEPQTSGSAGALDDFGDLGDYEDIAPPDDTTLTNNEKALPQTGNKTGNQNRFPGNNTDIPADLVNAKGDDVVAKQLREAALKEQDPVLREKLWDEYRKYKSGI